MHGEATRRDLLLAGRGLAAATAVGSLAGCVGSLPLIGGDGGLPGYAQWVPAPDALGGDPDGRYAVTYFDVATVRKHEDRFSDRAIDEFAASFDSLEVLPRRDRVDSVVRTFVRGGNLVYTVLGSFSADDAVEGFGELGEKSGEDGDYRLYSVLNGTAAVGDGVVVFGVPSGGSDPADSVGAVIDAERGDAERWVESDEDAKTLLAELGAPLSAVGTDAVSGLADAYDPGDLSTVGFASELRGDTTRFETVLVYGSADAVDIERIRDVSGTDEGLLSDAADVSASRSGRVATVSGTAPTDEVSLREFTVQIRSDTGGGGTTNPGVRSDVR